MDPEKCTICGYHISEDIPANGHTLKQIRQQSADCNKEGNIEYYSCADCGRYFFDREGISEILLSQTVLPKTSHSYASVVVPATVEADGRIDTRCTVCGKIADTRIIYHPQTVSLFKNVFTCTGKEIKPAVTVMDSMQQTIPSSDYTVQYSNHKNVGKAVVTVSFHGNYSGTVSETFLINPKGTSITGIASKSNKMTVKWKKQAVQTTGYEIQYSTSKKFGKKTTSTQTLKKSSYKKWSSGKLKAKKKYYIRIRTYKMVHGKKYVSEWSKSKNITVRK